MQLCNTHSLQLWAKLYVVFTTADRKAYWFEHIWTHNFEISLCEGGAIIPFLSVLSGNLQRLETFPTIHKGSDILLHSESEWKRGFFKFSEKENSRRTSLGLIKRFCSDNILYLLCNMKIKTESDYFKWIQNFLSKSNRISVKSRTSQCPSLAAEHKDMKVLPVFNMVWHWPFCLTLIFHWNYSFKLNGSVLKHW